MELSEWLQLALRWSHVFAGILWIGQTWLFTFLDRALTNVEANPGGQVFMVHSGGFYVVEKRTTLAQMPKTLHWFQWEAAYTWLSGIAMLLMVYWTGGLMVADPDASVGRAVGMGIGTIVVGFVVYDQLWLRAMGHFEGIAVVVSYALLIAAAWWLLQVMSPRAAYMHVGALMGTLMAANVSSRIIPGQQQMVRAIRAGETPDPILAAIAKGRSKHNTFLVLPVVFTMIGSHFPIATYGGDHPLLVLAAMILVGWGAAYVLRKR